MIYGACRMFFSTIFASVVPQCMHGGSFIERLRCAVVSVGGLSATNVVLMPYQANVSFQFKLASSAD